MSALRILREVRNYTQQFVAETVLGISQNTYSRLEASPQKITAEQAQKLSRFYKVSVAYLLSGCEPVVSFKASSSDNTNSTTQVSGGCGQAREKELLFLKEELEYFKKQNLELLRLLGEKIKEA
jgi:transcriptional regulator with XRE-family HTH domain